MHDHPSQPSARERKDKQIQRALLALALAEYPTHLKRRSLGWQIATGEPLDRAIRELCAVSLLFSEGDTVVPTIAARHFDWLELA
jgi:hypothetical protein